MHFSVIIPVFNRSETLYRAISSVFAQQVQDFEILVVDDGSSSAYAAQISAIVQQFSDSRIQLLVHPHNLNGAAARNTGIEAATGDYICFLDSDDEWLDSKLTEVKKMIDANAHKKSSILVHHQYANVKDGNRGQPYPIQAKQSGESVAHYSFVKNHGGGIQSSTICVSSHLAKTIRFNEKLKGHQDWDFAIRVGAECDNFVFIEQTLTLRHLDSEDSVVMNLDWRFSLQFLIAYKVFFEPESLACYMQKVVVTKAINAEKLLSLASYRLFWYALLIKPSIISFIKKQLISKYYLSQRIDALFQYCHRYNICNIILWGLNSYTSEILKKVPQNIDVIAIIDKKTQSKQQSYCGIPLRSIDNIEERCLSSVQAIVFVTDNHHISMKNDLEKKDGNLLNKIINF
ncbi:glycosyltransferase family 2 protein [Neptunicella sp.]|uniref:glycosyltransferase family 2 protein n=1 Tax=Neptunicella sp. TaxID=2125986 RepID=UPI003F68F714